jgi:hypothetical protein
MYNIIYMQASCTPIITGGISSSFKDTHCNVCLSSKFKCLVSCFCVSFIKYSHILIIKIQQCNHKHYEDLRTHYLLVQSHYFWAFNKIFSGTQPCQLVAGRNQHFGNHLCPHHHIRTLMMGTQMVPEMSVSSCNQLTRLCAREACTEFSCRESFKLYIFEHVLLF